MEQLFDSLRSATVRRLQNDATGTAAREKTVFTVLRTVYSDFLTIKAGIIELKMVLANGII